MITGKYTHCLSLNGVTTASTNGVGFGDIDLVQAGQSGVGPIIERMPRYPQLQYVVVAYDTTGTATADSLLVQALMPNGIWVTIDTLSLPITTLPGSVSKQYFGPFIDLRVSTGATVATTPTITAYIFKF